MAFNDKVVLVTGASSGIGAAIAIKFAKEGAKVAIVGRNETKLANVSKTCEQNGNKPLIIQADVSNDDDVKKIISSTVQRFGKLDVLVNNAGIGGMANIVENDIMSKYDQVMATNLRAVVYLTNLSVPHLIKTKGNIVNISSITSTMTSLTGSIVYCTAKAGLDHFTRCVALELAPKGVRVNAVNPGYVKTDFLENLGFTPESSDKLFEAAKHTTPLRKIIDAEEVADLVAYLASDKATSITGVAYAIDNGSLLNSAPPHSSSVQHN